MFWVKIKPRLLEHLAQYLKLKVCGRYIIFHTGSVPIIPNPISPHALVRPMLCRAALRCSLVLPCLSVRLSVCLVRPNNMLYYEHGLTIRFYLLGE